MPYNILMIAPTSFFGDYGCHVRILEEVRVLQKRGHRVTIVTYYKGRDLPELNIVRTRPTPWHANYEVGSSRHKVAFDALLSWTALRTARRLKPDIIHAHLHEGALIGRMLSAATGAPLVFDYQGSLTGEMLDHHFVRSGGKREWFFHAMENAIDRMPRAILTSSRHSAQLLRAELPDQAQRVVPMPDCVDTDFFRPRTVDDQAEIDALKDQLSIPRDRTVVIYLGLLAQYQGTSHIIQAARSVVAQQPDAHFLVMGYPNPDHYRAEAAQSGLLDHMTFTGRVPYEQAARYLRVGDIALAPKLSLTEGAGKILNYMACALPTVAFDTPQAREFMAQFGAYAERGSAESLAVRIGEFLQNPAQARALGQALRTRAGQRFSWDDAARRIVAVYDAVRVARPELRAAALTQLLEGDHARELVEVWQYRELLFNLTVRDLKVRYKNSVLGIAWSLLNPILMMLVFTLVYTVLLGQNNRRDYAAFILCGLLPWYFFSGSIMGGTGSIVSNSYLIKKVYFPRVVLPTSIMLSNLVNFLIALPIYFVLSSLLGVRFTPYVLFLPIVIVTEMIFIEGVSLLLSAANVFYRDVQQIMEVLILAWFFLTPVIWDANTLPASRTIMGMEVPVQRLVYILNPMASVISAYRDILYYGRPIAWDFFMRTVLTSLIVLVLGFVFFNHLKGRFAEEV